MNQVNTILLKNNCGMSVEILNFGARIKSIIFPINGVGTEMVLGYPQVQDYLNDDFYLGAVCGRVCNRIDKGKFELNGEIYQLSQNDNENCLHGGIDNFSSRFWHIELVSVNSVSLTLTSQEGEQGFPGTVTLSVTYTLTDDNKVKISLLANTSAATPLNLTNHAYFTLGDKSCESLDLQISSSSRLELKANGIPTGNILPITETDFDFYQSVNIGERQERLTHNLFTLNSFDDCYILNPNEVVNAKAVLKSKANKVQMTLFTNQTALQLYTGHYLSKPFKPYQGVCLEAQNYTDAVNHSNFPTSILLPDKQYNQQIIYQFSIIENE